MKKLFLASVAGAVISLADDLFDRPFTETRLAVIPTAANLYKDKPWFDEEIDQLKHAGFDLVMIDIQGKKEAELRKLFKDIDGIFVCGGNTYHLLFHARASGFDRIAKEMVKNGIPYIGSSAGSLLAGKTIDIARRLDDPGVVSMSDFTGLGLVDLCILPHIDNPKYKGEVENILDDWKEKSVSILGLTDGQALMVRGNYSEVVEIRS